ncbi:hypothetical protein AAVH_12194 [Aphelenchoides avenae]|nr:hypothetical protein AAVH_12194 [Aphelenchus avenae]
MMLSSWLLLLAGLVAVSMAQMTFSDGWGNMKRSVPIFKRLVPVAELRDAETQTGTEGDVMDNPYLDACHTSFSQSLIRLHQQIMALYQSYQTCQKNAPFMLQQHPVGNLSK